MPGHSLHEIESSLLTLWTNRKAREKFFYGTESAACEGDGALPALDKNGIRLYAELLNIGRQDLMASVFPGCARLIGDKWPEVVDDYLEHYPPGHYNLNRSADKLSEYLSKFGERYVRKYPFIIELADYEWLELEMIEHPGVVTAFPHEPLATSEQFQTWCPVVNPVLAIRRYRYPITSIVDILQDDCCLPKDVAPAPTTVIVYRDPENDCRFLEVGEMTAKVVEAALARRQSYKELVAAALSQSTGIDQQQCVIEFIEMVETLQSLQLFVGSVQI